MLFVNKLKVLTLMTCLVLVGQGFAAWDGTSKTPATPETINDTTYYIIDTEAKLAWYAANCSKGNAKLTADLDLGGHLWTPIAPGDGGTRYQKIFNGNGHVIKNLYINGTELAQINKTYAQNLGFVGTLGGGTIMNLILENVDIQASTNAGAILGREDSQISVGAFVGWMADKVTTNVVDNCVVASGTIRTTGNGQGVGGIVGNAKIGTISNCLSLVEIHTTGSQAFVGGIIGITKTNVTVSSCVYAGPGLENTGANGSVGGVVGNVYSGSVTATDSYFEGTLTYNGEEVRGVGKNCGKNCTVKDTTKKVNDTNIENVTCILNDGEWNESTNECSVTSGNWDVGGTGLSLNGYGVDGFKIVFNAKSGTFANGKTVMNKYFQPGMAISADEVENPSLAGNSFEGWALTSNATESVKDLGIATETKTIYAVWEPLKTITFNVAPGTFPDDGVSEKTKQVAKGDVITVEGLGALPTFYCEETGKTEEDCDVGHYFTGWQLSGEHVTLETLTATGDLELDAVWETVKTYTVTYNANEHGVTTVSFVRVGEGEEVLEPTAPVAAEGYEFKGWYTEPTCENKFVFNKTIDHSYVLYAKWDFKPYTITYVMNGVGNKGENYDSYTIETPTFDLVAPANVAAGNVFDGWFSDEALTTPATQVIKGSKGNKTFYAKWSKATYKIVYKATNDVQGGASDQEKEHGTDLQLRGAGFFSFKGYNQAGWISSEGVAYELNGLYTVDAPLTLYPTKGGKATYTVTYECEGCNLEDDTYTIDDDLILKDDPSPVEGKRLAWYSDQAHSLQGYVPKIEKGTYGNFNLHGQRDQIYKITYVLNGSTASNNMEDYTRVDVINDVALNAPAPRDGYTFAGWYKEASFKNSATKIDKNSTGKKTFYAKWTPETYSIAYNIDGEPADLTPSTYTAEAAVTLPEPTKDGYDFSGWLDSETGEVIKILPEGSFNDRTLTAQWTPVEYSITYVLEEGASNDNDNPASYTVETDAFTLKDAVKNGYTFEGWFNGEGEKVTTVAGGATGDIELTAQWTPVEYTITYENVNGATNDNATTYTIEQTVPLNALEKDGFAFRGWFTNAQFEGDAAIEISQGTIGEKTFYAKWLEVFSITYAPGADEGVTGEVTAGTKIEGEDATLLSVGFTREGYTQTGWKTEDGSVTYDMGATYTTDASVTLYPIWEAEVYHVYYHNVEGATFETENPTTYTVEDGKIDLNSPSKSGFNFLGWSLTENSTEYVDGIAAGSTGEANFYANWELAPSPITVTASSGTFDYDKLTHSATCSYEGTLPTGYSIDMVPSGSVQNVADGEVTTSCTVTITDESGDDVTDLFTELTIVNGSMSVVEMEDDYGAIVVYTSEKGKRAELNGSYNGSISDGIPNDLEVDSIQFNRKFPISEVSGEGYSTIVLPFTIDQSKIVGAKFYQLAYVDGDNVAIYEVADAVQANTPYIIRTSAQTLKFNLGEDETVTFNFGQMNNTLSSDKMWELRGMYSYKKWEAGNEELGRAYGFTTKVIGENGIGSFARNAAGAYIYPFRVYLYHYSAPVQRARALAKSANISSIDEDSQPGSLNVIIVDPETEETTVIGKLNPATGEVKVIDNWYDMKGRRLNAKPTTKGIYYFNGKRVIIK